MKVRHAKPDELTSRPRNEKTLRPRQLAIRKRGRAIDKVLNDLNTGPASTIKRVELDDGESLVTIRAAIVRRINETGSSVKLGVRNGGTYPSRGSIPRSGRG